MSFFTELKRRNVIRVAGLYLVGAWLIVQVSVQVRFADNQTALNDLQQVNRSVLKNLRAIRSGAR